MVGNDPVNYWDLWGLASACEEDSYWGAIAKGTGLGLGQGVINIINGLQDTAIGIFNAGINATPGANILGVLGLDLTIDSPDWSW